MFKFLKKDSFWLGLLLGIVLPAIVSGLIYLFNVTFPNSATGLPVFKKSTVFILGIVPNAILLRYYLVNLKADKTGRGILAVTFVFAIVFMILYYM
jgi:hypothetical protein